MRLPFLRSKPGAPAAERVRAVGDDASVDAARTRAWRRLVGALVLLVAGVVGFPLLFETQPRPLPAETPIALPRRDAVREAAPPVPPTVALRPAPRPLPPPSEPVEAGADSAVAAASSAASRGGAAAPVAATTPAAPVVQAAAPEPAPRSTPAPEPPSDDAKRARALLEGATAPPSAPRGRFVVQVGAYSDATALRETRAKVEKLGLKTYTQVVASDVGQRTRVRLGPFASRDEADAAAAKLRRAGLPANIVTL